MVFLVMVFGTLGRECQHSVSVGTRLTLPAPSLLPLAGRSSVRAAGRSTTPISASCRSLAELRHAPSIGRDAAQSVWATNALRLRALHATRPPSTVRC